MVLTLAIPLRKVYSLEDFITLRHLRNMGEVMLATGLIVAYGYVMETFMAWYSGNLYEQYMMMNRMFGPYGKMYWVLMLFNILIPQSLWIRRVRMNVPALFVIDRYDMVFAGNRGTHALPDLTPGDIPGWLEFVACRCS